MKGLSIGLTPAFAHEPYLPASMSFEPYLEAAVCDTMTLLMNKLDQLNEGTPEVQRVDSSHPDVTSDDREQQSAVVSRAQLRQVESNFFI